MQDSLLTALIARIDSLQAAHSLTAAQVEKLNAADPLTIITKVDEMYSRGFSDLSAMYNQGFSNLLAIVIAGLVLIGGVLPFLIQWLQRRSFRHEQETIQAQIDTRWQDAQKALDASNAQIREEIELVRHRALGAIFQVQAMITEQNRNWRPALLSLLWAVGHWLKVPHPRNARKCFDSLSRMSGAAMQSRHQPWRSEEALGAFDHALSALRDHPDDFSKSEVEELSQMRDQVVDEIQEGEEGPTDPPS